MAERTYYTYPMPLDDGYWWHVQYRVYLAIGKYPDEVRKDSEGLNILIGFNIPLAAPEVVLLDSVFADLTNVLTPPKTSVTIFHVKDIGEYVDTFPTILGIPCTIWFTKTSPDLNRNNIIEIHFDRVLTNLEKKAVMDKYANLISLVKG